MGSVLIWSWLQSIKQLFCIIVLQTGIFIGEKKYKKVQKYLGGSWFSSHNERWKALAADAEWNGLWEKRLWYVTCASCSDRCVSFGKQQEFRLIESIVSATNAPHDIFKGQTGWMTGSLGLKPERERKREFIAFLRRARLWTSNRASVGWCLQTTVEKKIWILWWNLFECYRKK